MANITLALDDDLLRASRAYAQRHQTSLNALIRDLLASSVRNQGGRWMEELLAHMQMAAGDSQGRGWTRDDIYDV